MIKIQPDDNNTCLTSSPQAHCTQCTQLPSPSDQTSCYRCLSSGSLPASQCLSALKDGRLLNYSSGLVETRYPSSLISSLCSAYTSVNGVDIFSSDNLLQQTLLSLKRSNASALNMTLCVFVDDAMPASKYYAPNMPKSCSVMTGYFRPNATGNWTFLGYGNSGLDLWVGPGATYGEHVLNSLLSIDYRMEWVSSPSLVLSDGVMYPFLMRSCRCGGPFRLSLLFSGPGFSSWTSNGTGFYYHTPSESESLSPAPPDPPLPPPSPSPSSPLPTSDGSSPSNSLSIIIGATIGGFVLLALGLILIIYIYRHRLLPPGTPSEVSKESSNDSFQNKSKQNPALELELAPSSQPPSLQSSAIQTPQSERSNIGSGLTGTSIFSSHAHATSGAVDLCSVAHDQVSILEDLNQIQRHLEINPDELDVRECVGWGSSGEVMKGQWRGSEVSIKVFYDLPSNGFISDFKAEVAMMSRLAHPNIVQLYGFVLKPGMLAIVSEFVPCGSLFDLLHGSSGINQERREAITSHRWLMMALDIARGMDYLHSCNPVIVHRDLKSPNLLINRSCQVKVSCLLPLELV